MREENEPDGLPDIEETRDVSDLLDRLWHPLGTRLELDSVLDSGVEADDFSDLIAGRYQLKKCIGSGSFGQVYRAFDTVNQCSVAVKLPRLEVLLASEQLNNFLREAEIAKQLDHEGIVPLLDSNFESVMPFIVMKWCDGMDLGQFLQKNHSLESRICWRAAARTTSKIARAIAHVHQSGITHRDLKPSNILLELAPGNEDGELFPSDLEKYHPRVTDFGLAHFVNMAVANTRSSVLVGTPAYLAPEQIERCAGADTKSPFAESSDIYALGMILFEILTGRTCFEGNTWFSVMDSIRNGRRLSLRSLRPDVPKDLISVCECCLSRDPIGRYRSAAEFADALDACCEKQPVKIPKRSWRQCLSFFSKKPIRIEQAGTFGLFVQFLVVFSLLATALAKSIGFPIRAERGVTQFWIEFLVVTLTIHIPIGWIALKAMRQTSGAVLTGFIATGILLLVQISIVIAILAGGWPIDFIPLYTEEPATSKAVYILMMVVFGIQLTLFGLAIPADHKKNKNGHRR